MRQASVEVKGTLPHADLYLDYVGPDQTRRAIAC